MQVIIATPTAFRLGVIASSRSIHDTMQESPRFTAFVSDSLSRHARGDWGDVDKDDKRMNDSALNYGGRVFSAYYIPASCADHPDKRIWIITEANRSNTTVLYPSEY